MFNYFEKVINGCGRTNTASKLVLHCQGARELAKSWKWLLEDGGEWTQWRRKSFDLKKDGGECPELVLPSPVIPNLYWIFLSLEALANRSYAKRRVGVTSATSSIDHVDQDTTWRGNLTAEVLLYTANVVANLTLILCSYGLHLLSSKL